jgi:ubiquitin
MDEDMSISVGKMDPVKNRGEIYGFDSFIDNLIATDMTGRGEDLVVRFTVNDVIIIDDEDDPMTVHECMQFLRDFMVDKIIDDLFIMMPILADGEVYSPDDDIRYTIFNCYRRDPLDNAIEDEEDEENSDE